MLVEDIDRLDLQERQKDLTEILRGIELSEEEEADARAVSASDLASALCEVSELAMFGRFVGNCYSYNCLSLLHRTPHTSTARKILTMQVVLWSKRELHLTLMGT